MYRPVTKLISLVVLCSLAATTIFAQKEGRHQEGSQEQSAIKIRSRLSELPSRCIEIPTAKRNFENRFTLSLNPQYSIPRIYKGFKLMPVAGDYPELCGSVIFSDNVYLPKGLYHLPLSQNEDFDIIVKKAIADYGGVLKDGIYYATNHVSDVTFARTSVTGYDIETGEIEYSWSADDAVGPVIAMGLDLDPLTDDIYGIVYREDFSGMMLAKIVYNHTPESTKIADLDGSWNTFMIDGDGKFYGIRKEYEDIDGERYLVGSTLCRIDRSTGAVSEVGSTGQYPAYLSGGCIDRNTGRMFWAVSDNTSGFICEIDKTTGKATPIYQFPNGEEVCGMYVPHSLAADKAPGEVRNVKAVFENGSLKGEITLTAPITLFDGSPASGNVTVHVLANGIEKASTQVTYGSIATIPVELPAAGYYNFIVYAENNNGKGPKEKIEDSWIGHDTPESTTVSLGYDNGSMNVSWLPVSKSVNGGYINPEEVTYDVVRYPDSVTVAKGIKETNFSETLDSPDNQTAYIYGVTAVYGDLRSAEAISNAISLGMIVPPYKSDFGSASGFAGFTVIDSNNDGYKWELNQDYGFAKIRWNSRLDMDDWLITPPVQLKAGESYELSFPAYSSSLSNTERLEVKWGKTPDAEGMTMTAVEPTDIKNSLSGPEIIISAYLTPSEDGIYYVGIHGISPADKSALWVGDISISGAMSAYLPDAVTDLTVTPDPDGNLNGLLSFKAPTETMGKHPLDEITRIEVRNGKDEIIHTFDNPTPGEELSLTVSENTAGEYTYSVICYNSHGAGVSASVSTHIGMDKPAVPANFLMTSTTGSGDVRLTWDAVDTDCNGNKINPALVTYSIYRIKGEEQIEIATGIKDTAYAFEAVEDGSQEFVQCAVFAATEGGYGSGAISEMLAVGTPYESLYESFANKRISYIWGVNNTGGGSWNLFSDTSSFSSQDKDNGFMGMVASGAGDNAEFISGFVSLKNMENPTLSLYTFNMMGEGGTPDENTLYVYVRDENGEFAEVAGGTVQELCNSVSGWCKVSVDLAAYKGKVIQFKLKAEATNFVYVLIDNISIAPRIDNDLNAIDITAPSSVNTGSKFCINVKVRNDGYKAARDYTVDLYSGKDLIESKDGLEIQPGNEETFVFEREMSPVAAEPQNYHAVINYSIDGNPDNNNTSSITVTPIKPKFPVVDNLKASCSADGIKLNWNAPDFNAKKGMPVTDDFEDAGSFADAYGDWIFVDADKSPVGGFNQTEIPGIEPGSTKGSFWVWDQNMLGNETFEAHSGDKFLFALYRSDEQQSDDWAVSPNLDGARQTVSFYAKSYDAEYPEYIEVWYSTGSTDIKDFVKLDGIGGDVPEEWTLYEAELPEGAKRFAIRSCAKNSFMLMVDDVTYIPEVRTDYVIKGYNVYRNGVRINDTMLTAPGYVDTDVVEDSSYSYQVTTVYEEGESAGSNEEAVVYTISGVGELESESPSIRLNPGHIEIINPVGDEVRIVDANGMVLINTIDKKYLDVPVTPGVYIVKIGDYTRTVMMK